MLGQERQVDAYPVDPCGSHVSPPLAVFNDDPHGRLVRLDGRNGCAVKLVMQAAPELHLEHPPKLALQSGCVCPSRPEQMMGVLVALRVFTVWAHTPHLLGDLSVNVPTLVRKPRRNFVMSRKSAKVYSLEAFDHPVRG